MPFERRNALRHNYRDDVVFYLLTWAQLLESELLSTIQLPAELVNSAVLAVAQE